MDQRLTPPWHPVEALPVALGAFLLTAMISIALVPVVRVPGSLFLIALAAVQQVTLAVGTLLWVRFRHRGWLPALGLGSTRPVTDVVIGAFAGPALLLFAGLVVFRVVVVLWEAIAGHPPGPIQQLPFDFTPGVIVAGALVVVVLTPVAEEIFFRGFLFGGLRGRLRFLPSAAISAAAFAVLHPPAQLMILIFVVGLGLAALYEWRRSLVATIAAHMAFNLIGYTFIVMQAT